MPPRTLLLVVVKPASRSTGVSVADGMVEVRVAAPPRDGLANEAVRAALAKAVGRPQTSLTLLRGAKSRRKTFEIDGVTRDEALARIAAAADSQRK